MPRAAAFLPPLPLPLLRRALSRPPPTRARPLACAAPTPTPAPAPAPSAVAGSRPAAGGVAARPRVLSGVQPTGALHLGNYLGALRGWVAGQAERENFFFVVDLHALTLPQDPAALRGATLDAVAMYLAAGIDPGRSSLFVQSHVRAHAELTWLLNCVTPVGWLERMIQFKEKKGRGEAGGASVGLFDYPVLMAADVLLYQTDLVPVGEDQRQHIELARDIARRYNDTFCSDAGLSKSQVKRLDRARGGPRVPTFREPRALMGASAARVMSLQDGARKMSKSDANDAGRINMTDAPDVVAQKIKRCKTDSVEGLWVGEDGRGEGGVPRPECANLLGIYAACGGVALEEAGGEVAEMRWGTFKPLLAEAVVECLRPIQARYGELRADEAYLGDVLRAGFERANEEAERTLDRVKADMGLLLPSSIGIAK
jgi:tryptophanyl-tRNA synthetase